MANKYKYKVSVNNKNGFQMCVFLLFSIYFIVLFIFYAGTGTAYFFHVRSGITCR